MTNTNPAAREIDTANLDLVVGGAAADTTSTDARKQEQSDKIVVHDLRAKEQENKIG